MRKPVLIGVFVLSLIVSGSQGVVAQKVILPRDLDGLASRAWDFWSAMVQGQRVRAAEFILPSDRTRFLNTQGTRVLSAEVQSIEFGPDRNRAYVRVWQQFLLPSAGGPPDRILTKNDWIWSRNNWYLEFPEAPIPFEVDPSKRPKAATIAELQSKLKFSSTSFDVGNVPQGQRQTVEIPVEYDGDLPVTFEPKFDSALVQLAPNSSQALRRENKSIRIEIGSLDLEGAFNEPWVLTFKYNGVEYNQAFTFTGTIQAPLSFSQTPAILDPSFEGEIVVSIRNNTDRTIGLESISSDGYFKLVEAPKSLAPGEQGSIVLKRQPNVQGPPFRINIGTKPPVREGNNVSYRLRSRGF